MKHLKPKELRIKYVFEIQICVNWYSFYYQSVLNFADMLNKISDWHLNWLIVYIIWYV